MKELFSAIKDVTRVGRELNTDTLKDIADILSATAEKIRKMAEEDANH